MGIFFRSICKKTWAVALVFVLAIGMIGPVSLAAKKQVRLSAKKYTINEKQSKKVNIKGVKEVQVKRLKVKSNDKKTVKAKKLSKVLFKVTGVKKGSTVVHADLRLNVEVQGKKRYNLKLKVKVTQAKAPATPTPSPTATPTATPEPTPTPIVTGSSLSLDKVEYKCTTGEELVDVVASLTPATANEPVSWTIADTDIAYIDTTEPTVNGQAIAKIGGKAVGSTTITATIGEDSKTAIITVEEGVVVASLIGVKQTKADEIVATLDMDHLLDNQGLGKDKFAIDTYDDKGVVIKTIPVNKIKYEDIALPSESGDGTTVTGTSATLTLDSSFINNEKVTVTLYKGRDYASSKDFVASVGAPATINLKTTEAQRDVDTPIEFELFDANGIDVTSTVDVDSRVTIDVAGDDTTWNTSPTSTATLRMTKIGAIATVTVGYIRPGNDTSKPDFTGAGVVRCIAPKPVTGTPHFMELSNSKSWPGSDEKVAKFYKDSDSENAELGVGDKCIYSFYASSLDDAEAISYDEYSVRSSDDDVASATVDGTGKYCNIEIVGNKPGKCNIVVKATKNTASTEYLIPVTILKENQNALSLFKITPTRSTVSNTYDSLYQSGNSIEVTAEDAKKNDLAGSSELSVSYEITSPKKVEPFSFKHSDGETISLGNAFSITQPKKGEVNAGFSSQGAKAGVYSIKATAYYKGETKTASCNITVKALPKEIYELDPKNAPQPVYSIETDADDLALAGAEGSTAHVRLKAMIGGVFAGYVYMGPNKTDIYPEAGPADEVYYQGNQAWRNGLPHGHYVSYIGDEVKFADGVEYGKFVSDEDGLCLPEKPNTVAHFYQVKGSSVVVDLRGAVKSGVKWQFYQPGYPYEQQPQPNAGQGNAEDAGGGGPLGAAGGGAAPDAGQGNAEDAGQNNGNPEPWQVACMVHLNDKNKNLSADSFKLGAAITDAGRRCLTMMVFGTKDESKYPVFYPDKKEDTNFALPGTYGATLKWKFSKDGKSSAEGNLVQKTASVSVKVTDDIYVPKIDVTKRTLSDFSTEGVLEVLRPACDLNCNISRHASVEGLYDRNFNEIEFNGNSVTVNYVKLNEDGLDIYVPLNAGFSKKA